MYRILESVEARGVENSSLPVKYLGVPLITKQIGVNECKELIDKVKVKVKSWKNRVLSYAGRLQLIASVLGSKQVYWASIFLIPKLVIKDIEKLLKGFLWCQGELSKGKAKVAWKQICKPRDQGGLGIKDIGKWNEVLMAKHIWNIASNKESLWVKWINVFRLKGYSIWNVQADVNTSAGWKQMLSLRDQLRKNVYCKIGNGEQCFFWSDKWCNQGPLSDHIPAETVMESGLNCNAKVCEMVIDGQWNFPNNWLEIYPILQFIPSPKIEPNKTDIALWISNDGRKSKFTIGKVWQDLRQNEEKVQWNSLVWYSHCIPKHSFILWLTVQGRLTTQDRLAKWYPGREDLCTLCNECSDSHGHLFFECKYSMEVWNSMKKSMEQCTLSNKWNEVLQSLCSLPNNRSIMNVVRRIVLGASVYFIWQERNKRLFGTEKRNWQELVKVIMNNVRLKLLSLRVKLSPKVKKVMDCWKIDMQCVDNEQVMVEWECLG